MPLKPSMTQHRLVFYACDYGLIKPVHLHLLAIISHKTGHKSWCSYGLHTRLCHYGAIWAPVLCLYGAHIWPCMDLFAAYVQNALQSVCTALRLPPHHYEPHKFGLQDIMNTIWIISRPIQTPNAWVCMSCPYQLYGAYRTPYHRRTCTKPPNFP